MLFLTLCFNRNPPTKGLNQAKIWRALLLAQNSCTFFPTGIFKSGNDNKLPGLRFCDTCFISLNSPNCSSDTWPAGLVTGTKRWVGSIMAPSLWEPYSVILNHCISGHYVGSAACWEKKQVLGGKVCLQWCSQAGWCHRSDWGPLLQSLSQGMPQYYLSGSHCRAKWVL